MAANEIRDAATIVLSQEGCKGADGKDDDQKAHVRRSRLLCPLQPFFINAQLLHRGPERRSYFQTTRAKTCPVRIANIRSQLWNSKVKNRLSCYSISQAGALIEHGRNCATKAHLVIPELRFAFVTRSSAAVSNIFGE